MDVSPEDVFDNLGLIDLTLEDLLDLLKTGALEIRQAWDDRLFSGDSRQAYHDLGRYFAPIALAIYDRLANERKEPRIPTYLAVNRYRSTECPPNGILFWADTDAITGLFESLQKDGYY